MKSTNTKVVSPFIAFLIWMLYCSSFAQEGFELRIESELDEYPRSLVMNSENNFVGIIWKSNPPDYIPKSYLYNISSSGDTISKVLRKPDTVLILHEIINVDIYPPTYLVTGIGYHVDSNASLWFSYFAKIDESLNVEWEKIYQLHSINEYACIPDVPVLLRLAGGGFLHACSLLPHNMMYLFQMDEDGDSVSYRKYVNDSSGTTCELTYNYDSTAYLLHTHFAHYSPSGPESQCIEIDFDLNQTKVMYYPRWFKNYMTSKLLPDGNLISSGIYNYVEPGLVEKYLANFKLDSNFTVINESYYTHPDTVVQVGHIMMDYFSPSYIYSGGTHNFQIGIWVPGPSWIVIARMNENLEIESEKYIGGDATYNFKTITATPDTGVLITATWYDFVSQSYERDVIIQKLLYEDFISVGINEDGKLNICSAIVYPNPGRNQLHIRTTLYNATFMLYDQSGKQIISKQINQNITNINVSSQPPGNYYWHIIDGSKIIETGKWIKTK
ncbi:MAG: T9SS type A sorting domain-containing protein [Bacteroidales bacterium]|nr:T9SS type A sorting domain-containing protein [Bacteroidales bacterium]